MAYNSKNFMPVFRIREASENVTSILNNTEHWRCAGIEEFVAPDFTRYAKFALSL